MSHPQDEPPDPEDTKILKHAGNLMRQLGLSQPPPDAVLWVDNAPPDSVVVQFGEMKLPRSMRLENCEKGNDVASSYEFSKRTITRGTVNEAEEH